MLLKPTGRHRKYFTLEDIKQNEATIYQGILMAFANDYMKYKATMFDPGLVKKKFKVLNLQWKTFSNNWNSNPKRVTELRETDFEKFIKDYETKQAQNSNR